MRWCARSRHDDALAIGLGRRVHAQWLEEPGAVLELQATELRSEGRLVLAADAQNGRFIWPAYSAGLRLIAIRVQSVPADVVRLARWFSELQADASLVPEFADWLWRGARSASMSADGEHSELGEKLDPTRRQRSRAVGGTLRAGGRGVERDGVDRRAALRRGHARQALSRAAANASSKTRSGRSSR